MFIFGTELYSYGKYGLCILNHLNLGQGGAGVCRKLCDAVHLKELHFSFVKGIKNVITLI